MMQYDPVPPEGCTCASFWTVRGKHKADCPLSPADEELEQILDQYFREHDTSSVPWEKARLWYQADKATLIPRIEAWHQRKLEAEVAKAHRRGRLSMYADIVNGLSEEDVKLLARLVQLKKDNPSE